MKYIWLLLVILLTCGIWYNSSMGIDESAKMSGMLAALLQTIGNALDITFHWDVEHVIRKVAHFCEFAFLCWLMCRTYDEFGVAHRTATGYIFFWCLFIAVIDEYIQSFAPGRGSMVKDILLDFSGAFCAWLWVRVYNYCR